MPTAIMTSKGQVTIPLVVREKLGLATGDRVEFIELDNGQFVLLPATEDVGTIKGVLRQPARPVSVDDMNRAIRRRAAPR